MSVLITVLCSGNKKKNKQDKLIDIAPAFAGIFFCPHPRTCLLTLERGSKGEREVEKYDVGDRHRSVASNIHPNRTLKPRHVT